MYIFATFISSVSTLSVATATVGFDTKEFGQPIKKHNQRTNGPVYAHLISGSSKSTKQTKPGNKYEKDLIDNS